MGGVVLKRQKTDSNYHLYPKHWENLISYYNRPKKKKKKKMKLHFIARMMCHNTAPCLIRVHSVCLGLFVRILRVYTIHVFPRLFYFIYLFFFIFIFFYFLLLWTE